MHNTHPFDDNPHCRVPGLMATFLLYYSCIMLVCEFGDLGHVFP